MNMVFISQKTGYFVVTAVETSTIIFPFCGLLELQAMDMACELGKSDTTVRTLQIRTRVSSHSISSSRI
jgi:hypothetical protein